jgi:hypothetical protein
MAVILVFVDGVGVGSRKSEHNPLARHQSLLSHFDDGSGTALPHGGAVARVDATLGIGGRPQSATGQTTIFTGVNAPSLLGRHLVGFPNQTLRQVLAQESIFLKVVGQGGRATFANAYWRAYLSLLRLPYEGPQVSPLEIKPRERKRLQPSASTCAAAAAGPLRTFEDAQAGQALTHDITGGWRRFPIETPPPRREPEEAAHILLSLAESHDFVLFEHFLLDKQGHDQQMGTALATLADLDRFLRTAAANLAPGDHLLVVSDHGNVEDLSTRSHTLNPVPLLCFGPRAGEVCSRARSLLDVTPWVLELLRVELETGPLSKSA